MNYTIRTDVLSVTVSDVGAQLMSITDKRTGEELLWQGQPDIWEDRALLLFPICGTMYQNQYSYRGCKYPMKSHGFLPHLPTEAVEVKDYKLVFLAKQNEETKKIYPFDFSILVTYELKNNQLFFDVRVENTGKDTLPYAFGWHPGFRTTSSAGESIADYVLRVPGHEKIDVYPLVRGCFVSDTTVPLNTAGEKLPLSDDLFNCPEYDTVIIDRLHDMTLACEKTGKAIRVQTSENLPYLCLWKSLATGADFVCIEPWSGVPNVGLDEEILEEKPHMTRLAPADTETYHYTVTFA